MTDAAGRLLTCRKNLLCNLNDMKIEFPAPQEDLPKWSFQRAKMACLLIGIEERIKAHCDRAWPPEQSSQSADSQVNES